MRTVKTKVELLHSERTSLVPYTSLQINERGDLEPKMEFAWVSASDLASVDDIVLEYTFLKSVDILPEPDLRILSTVVSEDPKSIVRLTVLGFEKRIEGSESIREAAQRLVDNRMYKRKSTISQLIKAAKKRPKI